MLGTESNGMQLAVMFATYARNAKAKGKDAKTIADIAMYTFYDAMERTALAIGTVLDAKRLPRESFDKVIDYTERLKEELELSQEADGDTEEHESS